MAERACPICLSARPHDKSSPCAGAATDPTDDPAVRLFVRLDDAGWLPPTAAPKYRRMAMTGLIREAIDEATRATKQELVRTVKDWEAHRAKDAEATRELREAAVGALVVLGDRAPMTSKRLRKALGP